MTDKHTTPACPPYLAGTLRDRWDQLAPSLSSFGTLDDLNADLLAKYILAENEYLQISNRIQTALGVAYPDAEEVGKWIAAQAKLTKQILELGAELGVTPRARRARGIIRN